MLYGGTVLSTRNARQAVGIAKLLNRDVAIVGPLRSTSMDAVGDVLCVWSLQVYIFGVVGVARGMGLQIIIIVRGSTH